MAFHMRPNDLPQRFRAAQSGAALVLVAVSLGVMMTVIALAFETSRYAAAKSRFNNAVDQALLAAAAAHATDPTGYARQYFNTNLNETAQNVQLTSFTVTTDAGNTIWTASAKGVLGTSIAGIIGVKSMALSHTATVEWDNTTTSEIVAMVDVSGTMCAHFQRNVDKNGSVAVDFVPDQSCQKLSMMQNALSQIATIGIGYSGNAKDLPAYKVGVVPFTYKISLPNPAAVATTAPFLLKGEQDAGYGSDYFTNLADAVADAGPLPPVLPLKSIRNADDKAALLKSIAAVTTGDNQEFNRPAWKRSSLGAEISGLLLDPRYHTLFGGEKPAAFGTANTNKIVIMMTDSANLGCCFTNWPSTNFRNHYMYSYHPDHLQLAGDAQSPGVCKQMKDAGIEIYTVLLDVNRDDMDARGAEIVDAFEHCASDSSHVFEIPYGDEKTLETAYQTIGKALIKLRLAK